MNKLALVGGSSAGIGAAIAEGLLGAGMDVVLTARGQERLEAMRLRLQNAYPSSKVYAFASDSASAASVEKLIASVRALKRAVDVLVLNTGGPKPASFSELTAEDWDAAYQQLFRGNFLLVQAFVPEMASRGWGRVVSVSSTIMIEPTEKMVLSCGVRALLANALKALSLEVARKGVTVNTVCPGAVLTERLVSLIQKQSPDKTAEQAAQETARTLPSGRIASPAEFSDVCVFLASEKAGYVNGTTIAVDGGLTRKSW